MPPVRPILILALLPILVPVLPLAAGPGEPDWERGLRSPLERTRRRTLERLVAEGGEDGGAFVRGALDHPDRRVRRGCLEALGRIGSERDLELVRTRGQDPDRAVRREAAGAGVRILVRAQRDTTRLLEHGSFRAQDVHDWVGVQVRRALDRFFHRTRALRWNHDRPYREITVYGRLAIPSLTEVARDHLRTAKYRAHALIALSRIGDPATMPLFVELLGTEIPLSLLEAEGELESDYARPTLLAAAASGLANLGRFDGAAFRAELRATDDLSDVVRSYSNWALTTCPLPGGEEHRLVAESVSGQILAERCDHVLSMIAYVAQVHGLAETVPALLAFLDLDPGYVRYEVLESLLALAPAESEVNDAARKAFLVKDVPALRVLAGRHLGEELDREVLLGELIRQFEVGTIEGFVDEDGFGAKTAIKALALLGGEQAREFLESQLDHTEDQIRSLAAAHLAVIADPSSINPLRQVLEDDSEYVRLFGARTLLILGDNSGLVTLVELLDGGNAFTATMAVELLRSHAGQEQGFSTQLDPEGRRVAVRRWHDWLRAQPKE